MSRDWIDRGRIDRDRTDRDQAPSRFEFSAQVVRVPPDMIARSVPGYRLLLKLTALPVRRAATIHDCLVDSGALLSIA